MGMNPSHFSNDSPVLNDDSQPIEQTLYENFEKMKNLSGLFLSDDWTICDSVKCMMIIAERTPSKTQELLARISSFNALSDFIHREDDQYSSMLHRIQYQVETGTECIQLITTGINDVVKGDEKSEESDIYSQSGSKPNVKTSKLKRVQQTGYKLVNVLNDILSELSKASEYIHPDHQKVELFYKTMKELESSVPIIPAEKQLVLDTLPAFLKEELDKLQRLKPKRIRSRAEQQALDEQEENVRRNNWADAMERVISSTEKIQERTKAIKNSMRSNLEQCRSDPKAFHAYLTGIDVACDQITELTLNLYDQFHVAREFLHPSQSALVQAVHLYNQMQMECQYLDKQLKIREGEIKAYEEMRKQRPGRMVASVVNGPPPGFEEQQMTNGAANEMADRVVNPVNMNVVNEAVPQNQNESFQFDEIKTDFMRFATEHQQQFQLSHSPMNGDLLSSNQSLQGTDNGNTDQIVPKMASILNQFKTKTSAVQRAIANWSTSGGGNQQNRLMISDDPEETQNALKSMLELVEDMNSNLIRAKQIIGPDAKYISRLENRYVQIMGLYNLKHTEVENKNDILSQTDAYVDSLKDDIGDLEYRMGAVMSSAVSNVEMRMKAFNDFGIKVQTFDKVMQLIDDTQMNVQQACQDIQSSVDTDLYDIIGTTFNDKQHQETTAMLGNVAHACEYILKAFDDIVLDFEGVRQFVHPDREMVETLQTELISMYEKEVMFKISRSTFLFLFFQTALVMKLDVMRITEGRKGRTLKVSIDAKQYTQRQHR